MSPAVSIVLVTLSTGMLFVRQQNSAADRKPTTGQQPYNSHITFTMFLLGLQHDLMLHLILSITASCYRRSPAFPQSGSQPCSGLGLLLRPHSFKSVQRADACVVLSHWLSKINQPSLQPFSSQLLPWVQDCGSRQRWAWLYLAATAQTPPRTVHSPSAGIQKMNFYPTLQPWN